LNDKICFRLGEVIFAPISPPGGEKGETGMERAAEGGPLHNPTFPVGINRSVGANHVEEVNLLEAWIAEHIVPFLESLFHTIGWGGVVFIMALESANIPIPSEVTMPLSGWLLTPKSHFSALQTFLIAGGWGGLGCLLGSLASYLLGYFGGRPFVEKYGNYILVREEDIRRFDAWFARWGEAVSFISRLLPIVRTFVSFPAGMFKVHLGRFSLYTFVGSFLWCGALALIGWAWGDHWDLILSKMGPFKYVVVLALVVGFVWYVWHHIRPERKELGQAEKTVASEAADPFTE